MYFKCADQSLFLPACVPQLTPSYCKRAEAKQGEWGSSGV